MSSKLELLILQRKWFGERIPLKKSETQKVQGLKKLGLFTFIGIRTRSKITPESFELNTYKLLINIIN